MATETRTPYSSNFERVEEIKTPDKYTVKIEYQEPYAPALESWGMGILPAHIYQGTDINTNPRNREPVGTGPYKITDWRTDDRIILEANKNYFEGTPGIERYIYKIIPDQSVQFMELKRGTVDWMSPTPDQWVEETSGEDFLKEYNRYRYPSFNFTYMGYNLHSELFKDRKVRLAINYAINKEELIDTVLQGLGRKMTGPYPPQTWAYNENVEDHGYNLKKAKSLLREAGWEKNTETGIFEKNGRTFSFTLMTNQGNRPRKLTAEIIQSQLKELGMDVKIRVQEWSSFVHQYIEKRQFDAIILGWSLSIDPDQYSLWHSSQQGEGQYNFTGYTNEEVDNLLEKGRATFDIQKRKEIYNRIHKILHRDQPYMFLYISDSRNIIHNRFKNIEVAEAGITYNFIDWYVPTNLRKY